MKKHIILILKTLFNNNACVEAARTRQKKYNIIPVIFAVFALFFSALPVCVTGFQAQGQNWVSTVNNIDNGLYQFGRQNESKKFKLEVVQNPADAKKHIIQFSDNENWNNVGGVRESYDYPTGAHRAVLTNLKRFTYEMNGKNIFEIYFYDGNVTNAADGKKLTFSEFYTYIANNQNPYNTNEKMKVKRKDDGSVESNETRNTSFMVFSKDAIFGANYKNTTTTSVVTLIGDYDNTKIGTDFLHDFYDKNNQITTLTNWKAFFNESYINIRWNNTWKQTGMILGINGGVLIFMGFMVWVLTRGKNNPFRIYSFWDGQKIAYYASLTPGMLSLFGFLSSSLTMMLFVLTCGVRVMWLSMRTLRYNAPAK